MPSKVNAYVWDKQKQKYITDVHGRELKVHIEDALELKEKSPHVHAQRKYMHLHRSPECREPLKLVENGNGTQFYSFIGTPSDSNIEGYDESESHSAAIEALSRLVNMKFKTDEQSIDIPEFEFTEVIVEPSITLPNGKRYFPDLLCRFDETHPLYDRWGGKLAIEVTYTHPCEEVKLHDFEFHCIPILEVVIEDDTWKQYPGERNKWQYFSKESIRNHVEKLTDSFSRYIDVNLLVDPISTRIHKELAEELNDSISVLRGEVKTLEVENTRLMNEVEENKRVLSKASERIESLNSNEEVFQNSISEKNKKIKVLENDKDNLEKKNNSLKQDKTKLEKEKAKLGNKLAGQKHHLIFLYFVLFFLVAIIFAMPLIFPENYKSIANWLWHLYH